MNDKKPVKLGPALTWGDLDHLFSYWYSHTHMPYRSQFIIAWTRSQKDTLRIKRDGSIHEIIVDKEMK